jgi:hypothetical protein
MMGQRVGAVLPVQRLRLAAVLAAAATAALFTWLVVRDDGKKESSKAARPEAASVQDLKKLPRAVDHAVFWAGPARGRTYELTRPSDGSIYIRYLPAGASLGDARPNFLTVGTYPHPNAFATVQKAAKRKGEYVRPLAGGGLAVSSRERPQSVYFAHPSSNVLVEIYAPSPRRARALVLSGQVRPLP